MADDLEMALAFVADREGRKTMAPDRWVHVLSLELGWMSPSQARAFVSRARDAGLLAGSDPLGYTGPDRLPPRGFRPDPEAKPSGGGASGAPAAASGFLSWVDRVAAARECSRDEALQLVREEQERMGGLLSADVAVLVVARRAGLAVEDAAREMVGIT